MIHNTSTHHIEVNINKAAKKMIPSFHRRCMVATLPECSFSANTADKQSLFPNFFEINTEFSPIGRDVGDVH